MAGRKASFPVDCDGRGDSQVRLCNLTLIHILGGGEK